MCSTIRSAEAKLKGLCKKPGWMGRDLIGREVGEGVQTGVPESWGQSHTQQRLPDLGISLFYQPGCKQQVSILNHLSKRGIH